MASPEKPSGLVSPESQETFTTARVTPPQSVHAEFPDEDGFRLNIEPPKNDDPTLNDDSGMNPARNPSDDVTPVDSQSSQAQDDLPAPSYGELIQELQDVTRRTAMNQSTALIDFVSRDYTARDELQNRLQAQDEIHKRLNNLTPDQNRLKRRSYRADFVPKPYESEHPLGF